MFLSLNIFFFWGGKYESPLTPKGSSPKLTRAYDVDVRRVGLKIGKMERKYCVDDHKDILHYVIVYYSNALYFHSHSKFKLNNFQ